MRLLRLSLWLVVGVLLGANLSLANAGTVAATPKAPGQSTIPATQGFQGPGPSGAVIYSTFGEACNAVRTYPYGVLNKGSCVDGPQRTPWSNGGPAGVCYYNTSGTNCAGMTSAEPTMAYKCPTGYTANGANCVNNVTVYTCPAGSTGPTLIGGQQMCTTPDPCPSYVVGTENQPQNAPAGCSCPAGSAWYPYGGCRKTCSTPANGLVNAGWDAEYPANGKGCYMGCESYGQGGYYILKNGNRLGQMYSSGWACGDGAPDSPVPADDQNKRIEDNKVKAPVCAAGDGVVTSSSGNVMCLPASVPNTSTPQINVTKKTETFSDNSTKQTTTTQTTDPYTGASDTRSTIVTSGGLAGPAGTSTSVQSSGTGTGGTGDGDGNCDPTVAACGGPGTFGDNDGLYTKKYPDGLSGLLSDKYAAMKATPLFGLVSQLAPSGLANSGTCPSWSFSGTISPAMNLGSLTIAPPCMIWDALRIILLITALLTARRLIFGG